MSFNDHHNPQLGAAFNEAFAKLAFVPASQVQPMHPSQAGLAIAQHTPVGPPRKMQRSIDPHQALALLGADETVDGQPASPKQADQLDVQPAAPPVSPEDHAQQVGHTHDHAHFQALKSKGLDQMVTLPVSHLLDLVGGGVHSQTKAKIEAIMAKSKYELQKLEQQSQADERRAQAAEAQKAQQAQQAAQPQQKPFNIVGKPDLGALAASGPQFGAQQQAPKMADAQTGAGPGAAQAAAGQPTSQTTAPPPPPAPATPTAAQATAGTPGMASPAMSANPTGLPAVPPPTTNNSRPTV